MIYTADVESACDEYDLEGITVRVESVFLVNMGTDVIYEKLKGKIDRKEPLDMEDLMQLMILPLTVKGKEQKQEIIIQAVELAKEIEDRQQKLQVLAGILTFTDKIVDNDYRERVKEEWKMTQIGKMIFDDGFQVGEKRGEKRGIQLGEHKKLTAQVCRKLEKGKDLRTIAEELEEPLELIESIYQIALEFAPNYDSEKLFKVWSNRNVPVTTALSVDKKRD